MAETFPTTQVLELACAAQRINKDYIKENQYLFASDGQVVATAHPNKILMMYTLGLISGIKPEDAPALLRVNDDDKELAREIQKYYKRLLFAAVQGDNEFQTNLNSVLSNETVATNKLGFLACLPSVYARDYSRNRFEKLVKTLDNEYLAPISSTILDKDCEVVSSQRSKNYEAWNIDAIIENKLVSWMSKENLKLGATVVVKAKVKDHTKHWKHEVSVTRLNYVKAAQ